MAKLVSVQAMLHALRIMPVESMRTQQLWPNLGPKLWPNPDALPSSHLHGGLHGGGPQYNLRQHHGAHQAQAHKHSDRWRAQLPDGVCEGEGWYGGAEAVRSVAAGALARCAEQPRHSNKCVLVPPRPFLPQLQHPPSSGTCAGPNPSAHVAWSGWCRC